MDQQVQRWQMEDLHREKALQVPFEREYYAASNVHCRWLTPLLSPPSSPLLTHEHIPQSWELDSHTTRQRRISLSTTSNQLRLEAAVISKPFYKMAALVVLPASLTSSSEGSNHDPRSPLFTSLRTQWTQFKCIIFIEVEFLYIFWTILS